MMMSWQFFFAAIFLSLFHLPSGACGSTQVKPVFGTLPAAETERQEATEDDEDRQEQERVRSVATQRFGHMRALSRKMSIRDPRERIQAGMEAMADRVAELQELEDLYVENLGHVRSGSLVVKEGDEVGLDQRTKDYVVDLAVLSGLITIRHPMADWVAQNALALEANEGAVELLGRLKRFLLIMALKEKPIKYELAIRLVTFGAPLTEAEKVEKYFLRPGLEKPRVFFADLVLLANLRHERASGAQWVAAQTTDDAVTEVHATLKQKMIYYALTAREVMAAFAVSLAANGMPVDNAMKTNIVGLLRERLGENAEIESFMSNLQVLSERNTEGQTKVVVKRTLEPIGAAKSLSIQERLRNALSEAGFSVS